MIKRNVVKFILFVCIAAVNVAVCVRAEASLMISPTSVVFEGRERFSEVALINNSNKEQRYKMGFIYHEMLPDSGGYKLLDQLGEGVFDLSKYIVFSPRQVRLAPGAVQKIRLAVRRPSEIPAGDHHVHFKFEAVPVDDDLDDFRGQELEGGKAGARLSINVNYSIPVILREGEPDVKAEIGQVRFERNKGTGFLDAFVPVTRSPESAYGVLGFFSLYHIDENGNQEQVGDLLNANLFPEIDSRTFQIPLKKEITGGSLRVVLGDYDKESGFIYAERTFSLEQ